ncbi:MULTISPECIES: peptidylprolyl isomerase [unclassified Ensifer]|uniref:peptidylprolyl isomerase n=1 Tax=unclassified Ensifer TaxID=2633371 RepID=UPI00070DD181|nr:MULTISPECIES: peptidylprolyl isomerase [unclassified Ensifer]KQW66062.1 peptidylprolyl isomerase [Ensifer sp. Root127]MBD9492046.1 peptidylprolyl isomerase [Ensifer sp. ENS11]PSS61129.1 peptidylprolyl isomerase [Ensifer sp. NM-2]
MSKFKTLAAAALVAAIAVHGVARAEDADPVIATVGGEEVRQSELNLALGGLDPQLQQMPEDQKRAAALSAVIDVKLLSKTAEKEGLQDDAAFKQRLAYLTERELHNAFFKKHVVDAITKEEVKARYDKEIAAVPVQEEIKARHILVKTEEEAKEIIKELDAGKSFVELAKAKSSDPNKDDGGDLGYFTKGRMVPEFDAVVFTLDKGAYTKTPVKTQFGFHVILVEDKRPQAPPALEQVEPQVRQLVMRDKYVELLTAAKKDAGVEISDPALKKAYDEANKAQEAK